VPRTSRRQHLVSRRRAELADRRLAARAHSRKAAPSRRSGHEITSRSVTAAGRRTVCKYPAWAEVPPFAVVSAPHWKGCSVHRGTGWATGHRLCLKSLRSAILGLGVTGASSANVQHLFVDFDRAAFGRAAVPPSLSRAQCHHRMTGLVRLGDRGKSNRASDRFGVSAVRPRPLRWPWCPAWPGAYREGRPTVSSRARPIAITCLDRTWCCAGHCVADGPWLGAGRAPARHQVRKDQSHGTDPRPLWVSERAEHPSHRMLWTLARICDDHASAESAGRLPTGAALRWRRGGC
jgi:hypothetical protein